MIGSATSYQSSQPLNVLVPKTLSRVDLLLTNFIAMGRFQNARGDHTPMKRRGWTVGYKAVNQKFQRMSQA